MLSSSDLSVIMLVSIFILFKNLICKLLWGKRTHGSDKNQTLLKVIQFSFSPSHHDLSPTVLFSKGNHCYQLLRILLEIIYVFTSILCMCVLGFFLHNWWHTIHAIQNFAFSLNNIVKQIFNPSLISVYTFQLI